MVLDGVEVRLARAEELAPAIGLACTVFERPDLAQMLPSFYAGDNLRHLVVASADGHIVSMVSAVPFEVRAGRYSYRAAHLGSVCTAPPWRGKGLASRLLALEYRVLQEEGVDLVCISGRRDLYRRSGATQAGVLHTVTMPSEESTHALALTPLDATTAEAAGRLWAAEPVTITRTPAIWRRVLTARPIYAGWTRCAVLVGSPPVAYVVLDLATDHAEVCELAGVRLLAVQAARHLAARGGCAELTIPVPDRDTALAHAVAPLARTSTSAPFPGTYRLLDPMRTFAHLWPVVARRDAPLAAYHLQPRAEGFALEGPHRTLQGDGTWVCRLLFGADGDLPSSALPVPLPWWYGLSYG